jgi:GTP-binding protein
MAGSGGDGLVSFRHEKFIPFGGPDGGNGGDGGSVILAADASFTNLNLYRHKRTYRAPNGGSGGKKKRQGKRGKDLVLTVPCGTIVLSGEGTGYDRMIADLREPGDRVKVTRGGIGGRGNVYFATATNRSPKSAERGTPGEEMDIRLEMRLIADVGIIGIPSAGKSTLLRVISAAKPVVGDFAFTTLEPVLGVVHTGVHQFVTAEIPGIIAGAHRGRGLGHDFLRHALRTRVLVHLISGSSPEPLADMRVLNTEMALFNPLLVRKVQIVVISKIDLPEVKARLPHLKKDFETSGLSPLFVSAATGEGVDRLVSEIMKLLGSIKASEPEEAATDFAVFHPQPMRHNREKYSPGKAEFSLERGATVKEKNRGIMPGTKGV